MKTLILNLALCGALLAQVPPEGARRGGPPGGGPGGGMMRMNPLLAALDADHDGLISTAEMRGASRTLIARDRNKDGKLTENEFRPQFGPGGRGPGGPGDPEGAGSPADPKEMVNRLMQFDRDGDEVVTKAELPERMQGMIARGDKNQDGKLTRDELTALAEAQTQQQMPERGGPGGERRGPPRDPLITALDTNGDGEIDGSELDNAPTALAKLDKNNDGQLTEDEVRPPFGPRGAAGERKREERQ